MRRFEDGFITIGRVGGITLRAHWSTPLGALLMGSLRFRPVEWSLFVVLVLLHELGHALAARALRLRVYSADLTPFGGQCVHERPPSETAGALIAAAGPAANAFLCGASLLALRAGSDFLGPRTQSLLDTFAMANFFIAVLNLLPIPPLDGARAWKLLGLAITAAWNGVAGWSERGTRAVGGRSRARRVARGHLRAISDDEESVETRDSGSGHSLH